MARGPQMRSVEADPDASHRCTRPVERVEDGGQLLDRAAHAVAAARGVLEHEGRRGRERSRRSRSPRRIRAGASDVSRGLDRASASASKARTMPFANRIAPTSMPLPRCEPTCMLTRLAPYLAAITSSAASTATDRSQKSSSGPARLMRYGAWVAIGATSLAASRARKSGSSRGGAARRRQAVGLSEKTWIVVAPMVRARSAALTMPCPSARWTPMRRPPRAARGSRVTGRMVSGQLWSLRQAFAADRPSALI